MSFFRTPGKPQFHVSEYRVSGRTLTLKGTLDSQPITRRVNLTTPGAGFEAYYPDGSGLIVRGHQRTPRFYPVGEGLRLKRYPARGAFTFEADLELMARMAADVWPLMTRGPRSIVEPIPTQEEHA